MKANPPTYEAKILIVDENPTSLDLLVDILEESGYSVSMAVNGRRALEVVKAALPDLILLDINLPGMDGFEVCSLLKQGEASRDIPVIFISVMDDQESKVRAFDEGGVDYISKPLQVGEVLARVRTHLSIRRLHREILELNENLEQRAEQRAAELATLNTVYEKFVPRQFLSFLRKSSITEVQLSDHVEHEMTIMFTDIRDFTQMAEGMEPQQSFNFLTSYLSRVCPVISKHNGFIDKYLGDGIIALFPEEADSGLEAAIAIREELSVYNSHRANCNYAPIRIGTGIHTGSLMLGVIGETERMESTVISDAVNLASRLESLTKLYGVPIIASEQSLMHLKHSKKYHYRFLDEVRVRGRTHQVKLYEIFDGVDPEVLDRQMAQKKLFEEALSFYQEGDLKAARPVFTDAQAANPEDQATRVFLARIQHFESFGKPDNWTGIQEFAH